MASESNLDEGDSAPPDGPLAPDATFGTKGVVTLPAASAISAARRADGSIGVLGQKGEVASLTIVKADGTTQAEIALGSAAVEGVVLTHKDGLVVAGASQARYFVTRIGADGAVDLGFTPDPLDLVPTAGAAAITKDGKVLIAGKFNDKAAIVRLDASGTLDTSFGEQGAWIASDDRAIVTGLVLGADDSIYAVTSGADKTLLGHFSAAGKADSTFGTEGIATLPVPASSTGTLIFADNELRYFGAAAAFAISNRGEVTPAKALPGLVIGHGPNGVVSAVTDGDTCTVHVTEKATASLTAAECSGDVSYVALGGGKRALVSNTADGVSVRVFGN